MTTTSDEGRRPLTIDEKPRKTAAASRARARDTPKVSALTRPKVAEDGRLRGDEALLAALLRGMPLVQAAGEAGISERTARRRVREPRFRARLDQGRAEVTALVAAQLAGGAEIGYVVLVRLAGDSSVPAAVRRSAARDLIAMAGELGAARDVEARLEALEAALTAAGIR